MRTALAIVVLCTLPSCAAKLDKVARAQAATDFQCAADQIQLRRDEVYGKYHLSGCQQKGVYSAQCLLGKCSAERLRGE